MKKQLNLLLIAAIALGTTALNADTHNYTIEDSWRGPEISEGSNQIVKLDKNQCYDITINMDGSLSASPSSSYCGHKLNVAWINTIYNKTMTAQPLNYNNDNQDKSTSIPANGSYGLQAPVPWRQSGAASLAVHAVNASLLSAL
jgi:hypothetical protein